MSTLARVRQDGRRVWRLAERYPVAFAVVVGGLGLVLFWQSVGPRLFAVGLLIAGPGWYAVHAEGETPEEDRS